MLNSARNQYVEQQQIAALGLAQAHRTAQKGAVALATVIARYQAAAAFLALEYAPLLLSEQGIPADSVARVAVDSVLTEPIALDAMVAKADTEAAFDRIVLSLIADAGRTAQSVDLVTRPAVTSYVRSLNLPSCGRCAVLAGRVYRFSTGFRRHPCCDCLMTPTDETVGKELVTQVDPDDIHDLSAADRQALLDGADLGQVVNVRRRAAGLIEGSSVLRRGRRLTPAGIYAIASDKAEALDLFQRHGYLL